MKRSLRLTLILSPVIVLAAFIDPIWGPLYHILFLALIGLSRVIYSALNFNDCESDAESLKKEIVQAKVDLAKKGFKFVT